MRGICSLGELFNWIWVAICFWEFLKIFPVVEYIEITPVLIITLAYEKNPYATSLTSFIACTDELIWSQSWVLFLSWSPIWFPLSSLIGTPFLVGGRPFLRQKNMGGCTPLLGPTPELIWWVHSDQTVIYNLGTLTNMESVQGYVEMTPD